MCGTLFLCVLSFVVMKLVIVMHIGFGLFYRDPFARILSLNLSFNRPQFQIYLVMRKLCIFEKMSTTNVSIFPGRNCHYPVYFLFLKHFQDYLKVSFLFGKTSNYFSFRILILREKVKTFICNIFNNYS